MAKWKIKVLVVLAVILAIVILHCVAGCEEAQKVPQNIKPLNEHLLQAPQDWKDAYGDTLETQLVYNAAIGMNDDRILQNAILQTARVMKLIHASDPNEVKWREDIECRVENLEESLDCIDFTPVLTDKNSKHEYYQKIREITRKLNRLSNCRVWERPETIDEYVVVE
jgi:hypothetical protein